MKKRQSTHRSTRRKFFRNGIAVFGFSVILVAVVVSFLGSLIRPDPTKNAADPFLSIRHQGPGFSTMILERRKNKLVQQDAIWNRLLVGGKVKEHQTLAIIDYEFKGNSLIVEEHPGEDTTIQGKVWVFSLEDVVYPLEKNPRLQIPGREFPGDEHRAVSFRLVTGDSISTTIGELREQIMANHLYERTFWLGTDHFGRDLLSRLMAGTIISLAVGFISVLISLLVGVILGALAGYFRGWVDNVVMWLINVVWSIPTLLLVIAFTFALGKGFWQIFVAVGLTMWVEVARVVRGQVMSLREKEYIEAGRALGFRHLRIIIQHILPNITAPIIVISAANFAHAILMESGLSFLGVGLQPPSTSWGRMIKEHYAYIITDDAYLALAPGLAIMLLVLAFMLVGNGLRDALDTKSTEGTGVRSVSTG